MPHPFDLPFFQQGLLEILLLSIPTGLIGSWIVLRGLAFYSHAIGTASFPGLVLADGLGFRPALGAFGAAAAFTAIAGLISRSKQAAADSVTALALVACLAAGVILASDVFNSGANVDTLLFGSLLAINAGDLWLAGATAGVAILVTLLLGHHWLAKGFDEEAAVVLRSGSAWFDLLLLAAVALTVTASLNAVGALLVTALMVVPAATVRMVTTRVATLQAGTVVLVLAEGTFGLWLAVGTNAPPGATIAVISGVVFTAVLAVRALKRRRPGRPVAVVAAVAGLLSLLGLLSGCGGDSADSGDLRVVTTTTQITDFVGKVGGDRVEVTGIVQPNTDPHEYEPRPSDVQAVADADLVLRSGGSLDEWTGQLITDSGSKAEVVDLDAEIPVKRDDDPHWWHDPVNVEVVITRIGRTLAVAAPADAAWFKANARRYRGRVAKVRRRIATCIREVPRADRKIVTDHDAFSYFTDRFGIEVIGTVIPALSTRSQPSAGDLAELERTIRREGVKAIFPESSTSPKLAEAVARDTGATVEHTLYGDSLGPEGSAGATWTGMMQANADSLVRGMTDGRKGCDFDPEGSRG